MSNETDDVRLNSGSFSLQGLSASPRSSTSKNYFKAEQNSA